MADEQTGLERLEAEGDKLMWGSAKGMGATDHTLVERSDTNKVTAGSRQSELRIAWLMFHDTLVARDNILIAGGDMDGYGANDHIKHYKTEPDPDDPKSGRKVRVYFKIDYWLWMIPVIDDKVITHQLTLWGYSREQFMRHMANIASINGRDQESGGLIAWFAGLGKK